LYHFGVIVPAFNAEDTLEDCLRAIMSAGFGCEQILVVDDASTDGTAAIADRMMVRRVTNDENLGPAEARNRGARLTNADVLFFVDADVVLQGEVRTKLERHFVNPGRTAVIGSYDDRPAGGSVVSDYRNLLHHHVHQHAAGPSQTFWTGIGAVRREAFLGAGGFKREWENIEDVEFGLRLTEQGGSILLDPQIQGTHRKVWTPASMFKVDLSGRAVPFTRLIMAGRLKPGALNTATRHKAAAMGVGLVLCSVLAGFAHASAWGAIVVGLALFLAAALDLLSALWRKRGGWFAVRAVPFHFLHYCAALLGYAQARLQAILAGLGDWFLQNPAAEMKSKPSR
jgi:hypothetical protein